MRDMIWFQPPRLALANPIPSLTTNTHTPASLLPPPPPMGYCRVNICSGVIEIPLALARVIGLAEALDADTFLSVRAEAAGYVPTASRVSLEPVSSDDWEILEANAQHLEGQMLSQVTAFF